MTTSKACRIAVVGACPFPAPKGSQVYMRDTARLLASLGHEVRFVTYGYGEGSEDGDLPVHRSRNVFPGRRMASGPSLGKPVLDLALVQTLRSVVRKYEIDLIDAHNYEALLVALAVGTRPILYHAHNAMADELPYYLGAKRTVRAFGRWLDRNAPRRAEGIVVPHARLASYLVDCGCPQDSVHVVPPVVNASAFVGTPSYSEDPVVLYTGNTDAYQNLEFLFHAMERVRERLPAARLLLALNTQSGSDTFPDYVDRVYTPTFEILLETLRRDAVFVCPRVSWSGYPIKVLNAMAASLPIVCCASAAHAIVDGETGRVVPDDDVAAFAAATTALLESADERRRLGMKARETVVNAHSPDALSERLDAAVAQCLGAERGQVAT